MRRLIGAVVVGSALVVSGQPTQAEALRYDAPAACPDASAFEEAVFAALGRRSIASGIGLSVAIGPEGRAAELTLTGPDGRTLGRRRVEADGDCGALLDAVALTAALALGPLTGLSPTVDPPPPEPLEPTPEPPDPVESEPGVAEPAETESDEVARPPGVSSDPVEPDPVSPSRLGAHLAAGGAWAFHPGAAIALEGGLRVERGRWSLGGVIRLTGAPAWVDGEVAGGRVRSGSAALGVAACGRWGGVEACPGLWAGVERHWGADFAEDATSTGPWIGASARLGWVFEGAPAWGPFVEVVAPLSRLDLTVDGGTGWRTPPVGVVGGVGVRW